VSFARPLPSRPQPVDELRVEERLVLEVEAKLAEPPGGELVEARMQAESAVDIEPGCALCHLAG